jgi:hypothetical protein
VFILLLYRTMKVSPAPVGDLLNGSEKRRISTFANKDSADDHSPPAITANRISPVQSNAKTLSEPGNGDDRLSPTSVMISSKDPHMESQGSVDGETTINTDVTDTDTLVECTKLDDHESVHDGTEPTDTEISLRFDKDSGSEVDESASCIQHTLTDTTEDRDSDTLENENKKLREEVAQLQAQRIKTIANLKSKKAALTQSEAREKKLKEELAELKSKQEKMEEENASLRSGLQKLAAVRDDVKNKLRIQKEILRESRAENEEVERKCSKLEAERKMLGYYRKLAIHTGYVKWGKPIRMLEAELAASLEKE